jgi:hypothetical protein
VVFEIRTRSSRSDIKMTRRICLRLLESIAMVDIAKYGALSDCAST